MIVYHNDHLGTPQKLTSTNGAVVWSAYYTAFGKATVDTEAVVSNLRLPGQLYDEESWLHYNWYRYYDPSNGRYFNVDPVGFDGGNYNLYPYVWNDPINMIDPEGLSHGKKNVIPTELRDFTDPAEVDDYLKERYPDDPKKRNKLKKEWSKGKKIKRSRQKKDLKSKRIPVYAPTFHIWCIEFPEDCADLMNQIGEDAPKQCD